MTEKTYLDPTSEETRFLTKFTVSSEKIQLYGFPPAMQLRSNLIKSLLDKLDTKDNNILAENIPSNKSLEIVWLYLNQQNEKFNEIIYSGNPKLASVAVQIWPPELFARVFRCPL